MNFTPQICSHHCQEQTYLFTRLTQLPRLVPYIRIVLILKKTALQIQKRLQESVAVIAGVKIDYSMGDSSNFLRKKTNLRLLIVAVFANTSSIGLRQTRFDMWYRAMA